jgi:hypothetical protein
MHLVGGIRARLPEDFINQVRYDTGNRRPWSPANIHTRPIPVSPPVIAATFPSSSLNEAILLLQWPSAFPAPPRPRGRCNRVGAAMYQHKRVSNLKSRMIAYETNQLRQRGQQLSLTFRLCIMAAQDAIHSQGAHVKSRAVRPHTPGSDLRINGPNILLVPTSSTRG